MSQFDRNFSNVPPQMHQTQQYCMQPSVHGHISHAYPAYVTSYSPSCSSSGSIDTPPSDGNFCFDSVIPNEVSNSNIISTVQCNQPSIVAKITKVIKWFVIAK